MIISMFEGNNKMHNLSDRTVKIQIFVNFKILLFNISSFEALKIFSNAHM